MESRTWETGLEKSVTSASGEEAFFFFFVCGKKKQGTGDVEEWDHIHDLHQQEQQRQYLFHFHFQLSLRMGNCGTREEAAVVSGAHLQGELPFPSPFFPANSLDQI